MHILTFMKLILFIIFFSLTTQSSWSQKNFSDGKGIKSDELNSSTFSIGSVQQSILSLAQFQALNGDCWKLMNGASLSNTDFGDFTGKSTLPDMVANEAFARQSTTDISSNLGSYQEDAIQGHRHAISRPTGNSNGSQQTYDIEIGYSNPPNEEGTADSEDVYLRVAAPMSLTGFGTIRQDIETRPKNYSINFFIKVNKTCNFN